jgi:Protein of unknown function (DUF2911)
MRKNLLAVLLLVSVFVDAQVKTPAPGGNKQASVSERIGITDVRIAYNRPGVKGREGKIWGNLVQYGFVDYQYGTSKAAPWRAGANENTVFDISTDVLIEGQLLARGKYGFFIAMGKEKATIIFSKDNNAWGSFYYNPKQDALRVEVPVVAVAEKVEWLKYEFDHQTDSSAILSLIWEHTKIPFSVSVDLKQTQIDEYRYAINNGDFYRYWQNMQEAAEYCLINRINTEEGLAWAARAVNDYFGEVNFKTLSTYSGLMEQLNRKREADSLMKKAMPLATLKELHNYGESLVKQKKNAAAFAVFKMNYDKHPNDINTIFGMVEGNLAIGKKAEAIKFVDKTIALVKDANTKAYLEKLKADILSGKATSAF